MKTLSPIDIQSKTFTRRETLGLFAVGAIGAATTRALAETSNDRQSSQRVDGASLATLHSPDISKPIVISF